MDTSNIFDFATDSKDQFKDILTTNQNLKNSLKAQSKVIEDLENSLITVELLEQKLNSVNTEINRIDEEIFVKQEFLGTILGKNVHKISVKDILKRYIGDLVYLSESAIRKNVDNVSFFDVFNIEINLYNVRKSLEEGGLINSDPSDIQLEKHYRRVQEFSNSLTLRSR